MIGKTISHYKILEKLGEGGMGVVYKAEDTKLDRRVALKFLTPQALGGEEDKARFVHEAKAAAALNHSNICTIHEIDEYEGHSFIAMEYVDGEDLRARIESGPLKLDEAMSLAIQIAEGLRVAHEREIVHRDIKPANIMVTARGQAKIMDFGLAKAGEQSAITKAGTALGTAAYMSPEQARGDAVDCRTDVWSLGVVLYEMVTGRRPFKGDYEPAVVYSILNQVPEPLTTLRAGAQVEVGRIVDKALAKNPDERYQSVGEFAAELELLSRKIKFGMSKEGTLSVESAPSVAVLPFRDMSPQKDQDYFCEGIAEELINALVKIEGLNVASRTSAFHFKGKDEDIRRVGGQLGVTTVLEGSVRKLGERLRITVQLVNVSDGYHLWSERFDRDMEDVFAIQDEISLAIVDKLRVRLMKDDRSRLVKRHTQDQEAYNLYLKGRYFWNRRYERGLQEGIKYFEQAIAKDPGYALAYAGIADCYIILAHFGWIPPTEGFPKARAAAEKSLEIDDTLGEAYASLGWIGTCYDWDWRSAERSWKRAVELAPNYAGGHAWYAVCLSPEKRFDEGWDHLRRAYELDPLSLVINAILGLAMLRRRQYDEALVQFEKTRKLDSEFQLTYLFQGWTYVAKEMWEDAIASLDTFVTLSGDSTFGMGCLGYARAMSGRQAQAVEMLRRLKELSKTRYVSPFYLAIIHSGLGDKDKAFEYLERAYAAREPFLAFLNSDPLFDALRPNPRFADLIKRIGLEM